MPNTGTCGVDAVLVIQVREEAWRGVGLVAVSESRRIQIDLHLRTNRIYSYG